MHANALQLLVLVVSQCALVRACPSWCAESRAPLIDCNKIACSHCAICDTIDSPKCTPALELDTNNERCLQGCNVKPNQLGDCRNCACKRCPLCLGWTDPEPVLEEGLDEPATDDEGVFNVQYPPPPPTVSSPPPPCFSPPPPPPLPIILPVPTQCMEGLKLVPNINTKPGWCSILTSEAVCVEHFAYNNTGMGLRPQPCRWIEGKCLMRICVLSPPPPPPLAPPHPASPSPRAPQASPTRSSTTTSVPAADASAAEAGQRDDAMLVPDRAILGMTDATSSEHLVEQLRPELVMEDDPAAYDGNLLIYAPMITATLAMAGLCLACFAKVARGLAGGTGRQLVSHAEEDDLEEDDDDFYDDDDDDDEDGEEELIAPQPAAEKTKANRGHRPNTRSAYEDE